MRGAGRCQGGISAGTETKGDTSSVPGGGIRRLGQGAVVVAALALVMLIWFGVRDAILAHRAEAAARVQAQVLGKALAFEEQLRRELLSIDQTLRILEYEWQRDPAHFDLATGPGRRSCSAMFRCNSSSPMRRGSCVPAPARDHRNGHQSP